MLFLWIWLILGAVTALVVLDAYSDEILLLEQKLDIIFYSTLLGPVLFILVIMYTIYIKYFMDDETYKRDVKPYLDKN